MRAMTRTRAPSARSRARQPGPWLGALGVGLAVALGIPAGLSGASNGGGGGSSGPSIWAYTWWAGSPKGPGPYTGSSNSSQICIWHDLGPLVTSLNGALDNAGLPATFWTVPLGGGHPGIWGVDQWAVQVSGHAPPSAHFDLVACPSPGQVPQTGGDVESDIPTVVAPSGRIEHLWIFSDVVPDPPPGGLPPIVGEAFDMAHLGSPVISTSPAAVDGFADTTVVNFPTWLWIDPAVWRTVTASAAGGGLVATVWAVPIRVDWGASWDLRAPAQDPQGGTNFAAEALALACDGPGVPYDPQLSPSAQSSSCLAVFDQSTFGTAQRLMATIVWQVYWAVSDPAGVVGGEGELPDSTTSGSRPLRVVQVESIITQD